MWIIKSCPRCKGDIFIDDDVAGCFEKYLQCGYEREMDRCQILKDRLIKNNDEIGWLTLDVV
jgi:hypothetical protein